MKSSEGITHRSLRDIECSPYLHERHCLFLLDFSVHHAHPAAVPTVVAAVCRPTAAVSEVKPLESAPPIEESMLL